MSFGGKEESPVLDEAVAYAAAFGAVLVVAAGNEGRSAPSYPAATMPAISVAATSVDDTRPAFSNYGNWIRLSAPGQSIVSTFWDARNGSTYQSISGTSMAAPHVSGVVALMFSLRPSLTINEIGDVLSATVDPIASSGVGAGRVNAARAVAAVSGQGPLVPEQLQATPTAAPLPTALPAPTSAPTARPPVATREPTVRPPFPPTARPPQMPPANQPFLPPVYGTPIPFPQVPTPAIRR
jgi:subtilisin family serine protease